MGESVRYLTPSELAWQAEQFRADMEAHAARALGSDAEDAVSDTILNALGCLEVYDPETGMAGLSRWLHSLLRRHIGRYLRERQRERAAMTDERWLALSGLVDEHCRDPHPAMAAEMRHRLRHVDLSPIQRHCLADRLDGIAPKRTARQLGISPWTVYAHVRAAVKALRACKSAEMLASPELDAWLWRAACRVSIYRAPQPTGRALDVEKLRKLK